MLAQDHNGQAILDALRLGVDHVFTIRVRALELQVRTLSIHERVKIINDVTAEIAQKPLPEQNSLTESALLAARTLELATTPEPDSKVAPRLPAQLTARMTNDEVAAIMKAYQGGCDILDPAVEELSSEKLLELVDEAKKNPSALIGLQPSHLAMLVRFLLPRDEQREGSTPGG